jgi:hypothetical protein
MRCFGSENIAISDEEKNADIASNTIIVRIPRTVTIGSSMAGSCGTPVVSDIGHKPILPYTRSGSR